VLALNCNPVPPDGAGLAVSADVALHHRMRMPVISISDEMTGTGGRRCDAFSIESPVGIRVHAAAAESPSGYRSERRALSVRDDLKIASGVLRLRVLFPDLAGAILAISNEMPLRLSHGSLALSFDLARWPETVQSTGVSRMLSTDERAY
jgi:hypothetical protein